MHIIINNNNTNLIRKKIKKYYMAKNLRIVYIQMDQQLPHTI